jgi:hypothetical protein
LNWYVCPVSQIYSHTSSDRLQLVEFYESELGQVVYSWRSISVEPLINRTYQRRFQNRSFASKRVSESSSNSTIIGIGLSDHHDLLQLQNR